MGEIIDAHRRFRRVRSAPLASHKFPIGVRVIYRIGQRSEATFFRVISHMPDGGQGLQYRLRSDVDGHERVTIESALERPAPTDLIL